MSTIALLVALALGADAPPSGWSTHVLIEAPRGLGGAAIGDLDPQSPGNEVTAVSANGDVWLARRDGAAWRSERIHTTTGELIMCAIGDADPRYPGNEWVGVGMIEGEESLSGLGQVLMLRLSEGAWVAERLFSDSHMPHGVAIGDVAARYEGNEVVICGFNHRVTLLHQEGHGYASEVIYVGNNRQKVLTIADVIPEHEGNEVVVCGTDGNVVAIWESGLGWQHELVFADTVGQSRVAVGSDGVLIGGDSGVVTLAQRVEGRWAHTFLAREAGKMRGTVIADVDGTFPGDEFYACGYARRVLQVVKDEQEYWISRVIYEDPKPLHHLVAGELDAGHEGLELITCGHDGRLVMLYPEAPVSSDHRATINRADHTAVSTHGIESDGAADRQEFRALYKELLVFRQRPEVQVMSITSYHNDCEAFRQIVRGGERFLPFIVEEIEAGDFFMNQAMHEITGIDVHALYPNDDGGAEQSISTLWLRWWKERQSQ